MTMIEIEHASTGLRLIRNNREIVGWVQISGITSRGDTVAFDPIRRFTPAELREIAKLVETRK